MCLQAGSFILLLILATQYPSPLMLTKPIQDIPSDLTWGWSVPMVCTQVFAPYRVYEQQSSLIAEAQLGS